MIWLLIRAVIPLTMLVSSFVFAERFVIYAFDPRVVDPAALGLKMREERIQIAGSGEMVIWQATAKAGRPTILYLLGNAGNLSNRHQRFKNMLSRGYGVVAPAYPGSSGSEGWPTQELMINTITQVYRGITSGEITGQPVVPIVYGESIGAAVALQVLANDALVSPRAVVLEAPFTSLDDVAGNLDPWVQMLSVFLTSHWESIKAVPKLSAPLLVVHGSQDALIPIAQGRAIFEAAGSTVKEFYTVKGAGHTNVWTRRAQRHFFAWIDAH